MDNKEINKMFKELVVFQGALECEWDKIPEDMQLDIKKSLSGLRTTVYSALCHVLINSDTN